MTAETATPLTDNVSADVQNYSVYQQRDAMLKLARDLELKLHACRDALATVDKMSMQRGCESCGSIGYIVKTTLKQTAP